MLLTGPNMGGKSTTLRMTCISVILCQIGKYKYKYNKVVTYQQNQGQ